MFSTPHDRPNSQSRSDRGAHELVGRVRDGARVGTVMGAVFSGWVLLLSLVTFRFPYVRAHGGEAVNVLALTAIYLSGGAWAGGVAGAGRRWAKWWWGAVLLGVVAAAPIGAGFRVLLRGFAPWRASDYWMVAVFAVALGGTGALAIRASQHRRARRAGRRD